ncbi:hypothetical protein EVAR_69219_1 [Eumeta japonica]|uniref:Histone-lysine N-methyltransferase SETMAR n=1 Tax=Eumeta variegata TaxID=151549 RepID=A0A4C1TUQ6_EUMVA|nr:hypothetical protein EVAR_69219_1 [Eumeta japonica]
MNMKKISARWIQNVNGQTDAPTHKTEFAMDVIREAGLELFEHSAYPPDVAPSDFYLFLRLNEYLRGKKFTDDSRSFIFGLSEDQGNVQLTDLSKAVLRAGKTIMFVKASGPVVFSDSSDSSAEDDETNKQDNTAQSRNTKFSNNESDNEQPNKKKKLC